MAYNNISNFILISNDYEELYIVRKWDKEVITDDASMFRRESRTSGAPQTWLGSSILSLCNSSRVVM
jgi:hypothetical protein